MNTNRCLRYAALIALCLIVPVVANAQTFHLQLPLNGTFINPCVPEDVIVQGQINIDTQQNFDSASGSHFDVHIVSKGKGTGTITLANYTYSEETENSLQIPGPPQTVAQEFVLNHLLISNGSVPNYYLRVRLHLTLNAAGIPTATVDKLDTNCP